MNMCTNEESFVYKVKNIKISFLDVLLLNYSMYITGYVIIF